ncbi:response regulator [Paenibacillaceae bacterium]|nr:response regulator [Paenibacillaceae bacterium]
MNLLIVEDELRLRTSLANNISWEEHGVEVIALAGTGSEALMLFKRKKPDIVLLDIQIPEMDGITLAREFMKLNSLVKIVILSGHDNFAFAQSALEIGVMKYLLKPAGDQEILQAVLEAATQLRGEMDQLNNQVALQQKWHQHLPHLQNSFFQHWATGKYDLWEINKHSKEMQIDLSSEQQYAVAVLDMDPLPEGETRFGDGDGALLQFSLHSIVKELKHAESFWIFTTPEGGTALIFYSFPEEDENSRLLYVNVTVTNLLSRVKDCLKLTASAGICGGTGSWKELHQLYAQACRALQGRIVYGHNIAIPYQEKQGDFAMAAVQPNTEKALEIAIETGDGEKASGLLDTLWEEGIGKADSIDDVHEHVFYFSSLLIRMIQKQGWRLKEVVGADFVFFQNAQQLTSKEQIAAWLYRTVKSITAYVHSQRQAVSNETVKQILLKVERDIDKELTLHTVADELYVNSSYLSRLFKQETGQTFSAYVLEHKMERAKSLLQRGAKVYDAANQVGYRDVSYFTKVFRKYWGVTPGEVRA